MKTRHQKEKDFILIRLILKIFQAKMWSNFEKKFEPHEHPIKRKNLTIHEILGLLD